MSNTYISPRDLVTLETYAVLSRHFGEALASEILPSHLQWARPERVSSSLDCRIRVETHEGAPPKAQG